MAKAVAFVEELAEVALGPNGVSITARSGVEVFAFRADLVLWREFIEREAARLNTFDAEQRRRVVPFKKGARRH